MTEENSPQGNPHKVTGRRIPWRRDPIILRRLEIVQRRHFAGESNRAIAESMGVDHKTIDDDLRRLQELWIERIATDAETLRSQLSAKLEHAQLRALGAAEFDEQAERAVLYGETADGTPVQVERDSKGGAQFRGQKAQALNVYRQAVMDQAKVLGVVVDKQEHSGEIGVRRYVGVDVDQV